MNPQAWMEIMDWSCRAEADLAKMLGQVRELGLGFSELDAAAVAVWDLRRRCEEELESCDA